ncbi:MAG: hypothetical protein U0939_15440 [Pirellulales bacterium]
MRQYLQPRLVLEGVLILSILVGAVLAVRSGLRYRRISDQNVHLVRQTGRLQIDDPTRVHMLATPTGEPMHWLWRVYYPVGYSPASGIKTMSGAMTSGGGSPTTTPQEFWLRVRLRETSPGTMQIYSSYASGSSLSGLEDGPIRKEFPNWWNDIEIEQLAIDEPLTYGVDEGAVYLTLRFPPHRLKEIEQKLGVEARRRYEKGIVRCYLGKVKDDAP